MKERRERKNLLTVDFLRSQIGKNPIQSLFDETKETYRADKIFASDEKINLRAATVESIVQKLESHNLSETSEDVKGIAFERFLGGAFRSEIGQFFCSMGCESCSVSPLCVIAMKYSLLNDARFPLFGI